MIEQLIRWDKELFQFLNGLHGLFWDTVMWHVSDKEFWYPFYLLLILYMIWKFRWKTTVLLVTIALLITLGDQISVHLFKEVFQRLRPCHEPGLQGLVHTVHGRCGGQYGFISSHASNTFALAMFLHGLFRNRFFSWFIFVWASVVSYSRIYLGVHYPGDVLGGALLGMLLGYLVYFGYNKFTGLPWYKRLFFRYGSQGRT